MLGYLLGNLSPAASTHAPFIVSAWTRFLARAESASSTVPAAAGAGGSDTIVAPALLLVLCVVAGVGTVMLLPGRQEAPFRKIGGVIVLAAALVLAALLVRYAARALGGADGERGGMGVYFWVFSAVALGGALRVVTHPRPVYSALYFVLTVFATAGLFILLWAEFMAAALVLIYAGAILVTYVFVIMLASQATSPGNSTVSPRTREGAASGNGSGNGGAGGGDGSAAPYMGLAEYDAVSREPLVASAVGFALMGVLLFVIFDRFGNTGLRDTPTATWTVAAADAEGRRVVDEVDAADREAAARVVRDAGLTLEGPVERSVTGAGSSEALGRYLFRNQAVNLELAGLILTVSMVGAIIIARRRVVGGEQDGAKPQAAGEAGRREVMVAPMTPVDDDPHSIPVYGTRNPRQKAFPET